MRILKRWTISANFDSRERPYQVETTHNDSLLTSSQLPLLQVRIPSSLASFCAQKNILHDHLHPMSKNITSAQLRHHNHYLHNRHLHRATLSGYYLHRTWTNHSITGTSPTPSRASTAVSPTYVSSYLPCSDTMY